MGLLDKFKNMFTEEVEEDEEVEEKVVPPKVYVNEPVESKNKVVVDEKKVAPPSRVTPTRVTPQLDDDIIVKKYEPVKKELEIKKEEKVKPVVEDPKPLKREEKFVFPVYFDDKDFEKIEKSKPKVEEKKVPEKKDVYGTKIEKKEPSRVFTPTPIISPIYGILNQNYQQENIVTKRVTHSEYRDPSKPITIDEVRKKAYGNLENEIEAALLAKSSIFMEPEKVEEKEESKNNLLSDLVDDNSEYSSVDDFLNSPTDEYEAKHKQDDDFNIKKTNSNRSSSRLDQLLKDDDDDDNLLEDYIMNNNDENVDNKDDEDLTQSDLFNLIDSMYEKGEED